MTFNQHLFKILSFCLIGSAPAAAAASGIAGSLSISLFAVAFAVCIFTDTSRLKNLLPARFFIFTAIVYLCFMPVDYFLLSSDWQSVLLHALWFMTVLKFITRANDNDWPPLYFLGSIQWIPTASQPTGTIFWICFAVFIVSGISALMLFLVTNHHIKITAADAFDVKDNIETPGFPFRAFFISATGITVAVTAAAIPLFFLFPRLPMKSGAQVSSDTVSSYADLFDDIETIELGRSGLPQQPETIVMRVKTDVPLNRLPFDLKWRGISYDHYDGRAWTLRRREHLSIATQGSFYKLEESVLGSELVRQTIFMEETLTNTVYTAHRAIAVSAGAGFLRRDGSDNLFTQYTTSGKTDYIVVSDTTLPDAEMIPDWAAIPEDIRATWLQLPELDPRIAQLANEITHGYGRQYEKAIALEAWLSANYAYTTTLPKIYNTPESGDPLAVFLFDAHEGYCEYFATAMTVMLRAVGIPARITSGFLAGEYNPIGGSWTVRRKHSHIWTEAWFPPYGWIEFDATPAEEFLAEPFRANFFANIFDAAGLWLRENVSGYDAARQYSVISGFFTRVNQAEDRAGEFLSSSANRARGVFHLLPQPAAATITALIILFIVVFGILILRRTRRWIPGKFRWIKQTPRTDAVYFYAQALVFLKSRGFIPEKAQTPLEFAKSLDAHPAAGALLDLTLFYNEFRFGDPDVSFPRDEARSLLRSFKTALTFQPVAHDYPEEPLNPDSEVKRRSNALKGRSITAQGKGATRRRPG